ncbi:MAG: N-acetyltransferase family protein [Candidatus Dormibacteraeota bacterium]|nr:N-acetyltransferase family protein [Candidatus Dormibacteraeota bacterium]
MAAPTRRRDAREADLAAIVAIYNASIPGGLATADTAPVTVASRRAWFATHSPKSRPLWVLEEQGMVCAWLSLQDFYGRPAYRSTAEVSVYVAPRSQRRGFGRLLLQEAVRRAPSLGITRLVAFVFRHNVPSRTLFEAADFGTWGTMPGVAALGGRGEVDLVIYGRGV